MSLYDSFHNPKPKRSNKTVTEKGAKAFVSTKDALLDLYYLSGGLRGQNDKLIPLLEAAYEQSPANTRKLIFFIGDIRGIGLGERSLFKTALTWLYKKDYGYFTENIHLVPKYNRWDSLFLFPESHRVISFIKENFDDPLLAKWLPRKGQYNGFAKVLMTKLGLTPRQYRKAIVRNTKFIVERNLTNKDYSFDYKQVPSVAFKKYRKAFLRNDQNRFETFLNKVKKGQTSVKAGAIFPHDILGNLVVGKGKYELGMQEQWDSLPNYVGNHKFLPIVDVSGSMFRFYGRRYAHQPEDLPARVAISLGIYLAQRNKSIFYNTVMTFHESPALVKINNDLRDSIDRIRTMPWGGTTNLVGSLRVVLDRAQQSKVSQGDMPEFLIILSDMQFDGVASNTSLTEISRLYEKAGYEMPQVIFWNIRSASNVPAKKNKDGVILASGYSPSIFQAVTSQRTPLEMLQTVLEYYSDVR